MWLLQRMDELKKRAYLAKYLVKLDVPAEMLGDADVADVHVKYEELIDQFKSVHREYEALRTSGFSTAELRRDITAMEEERDLVLRRIERMKQKVEGTPNSDAMLTSARGMRQEREKQKEMVQQKTNLQAASQLLEQRISRLQAQLKDIRKAGIGTTPEGEAFNCCCHHHCNTLSERCIVVFMSHLCLPSCFCVNVNRVSHSEGKAAFEVIIVGFASVVIFYRLGFTF
ncbi:Intraflagellar transport protein 81 [Portunus trituberculatus]|uniref:Intraflagellar transport protein 81 n=1 Tax=Portunus trituberculatus TaxID=210409 RepID=A0A5B7EEX2_PORTR|nr:Intraflagellar transport protein 81 [Portunus trituberculatus]